MEKLELIYLVHRLNDTATMENIMTLLGVGRKVTLVLALVLELRTRLIPSTVL